MARTAKSDTHILALSANWQALFITATILGWLSMVTSIFWVFIRSPYIGTGTWIFQITTWLHPVAFLIVAFMLLGHYQPVVKRVFMACFATVIGMALYGAVSTWEEQVWSNYLSQHPVLASDTSLWSSFGNEWTMMLAGLAVYTGVLYLATRKSRR
jgi:hypothetical protein